MAGSTAVLAAILLVDLAAFGLAIGAVQSRPSVHSLFLPWLRFMLSFSDPAAASAAALLPVAGEAGDGRAEGVYILRVPPGRGHGAGRRRARAAARGPGGGRVRQPVLLLRRRAAARRRPGLRARPLPLLVLLLLPRRSESPLPCSGSSP